MAGPWEDFATNPTMGPTSGPWQDFAAPAPAPAAPSAPADTMRPPSIFGAGGAALEHGIASGATFGLADKAAAALAALTLAGVNADGTGRGFRERYADLLAKADQANAADMREHPLATVAGNAAGAIASGRALPSMGPVIADNLVGRGLGAAATGAAYGAGSEAVNGASDPRQTWKDVTDNTLRGAGVGAALGAAASGVASGAGALAERNLRPSTPGGVSRPAADGLAATLADAQAGGLDPRGQAARLGPNGMVADLAGSPSGLADAAANAPGAAGNMLRSATSDRALGAPSRVATAADTAMGAKPANIVQALDQVRVQANAAARPYYDIFQTTPVPFTRDLEQTLGKIANEPSVLAQARRYANLDPNSGPNSFFAKQGADGTWTVDRVPNATEWDYIKRGLDDLAQASPNDRRIFGALSNEVKLGVDTAISPTGDPAGSPWAIARGLSAEGFGNKEALEFGQKVWAPGTSRAALEQELAAMSPGEQDLARTAARHQFQEMLDNHAGSLRQIGEGADSVLGAKALTTPAARDKMAMLFGDDRAKALSDALSNELLFAGNANRFYSGSGTAGRLAYQNAIPGATSAPNAPNGLAADPTGMVLAAAKGIYNNLSSARNSALGAAANADLGKMLTTKGADAQQLIDQLLTYARANALAKTAGKARQQKIGGMLSPVGSVAAAKATGLLGP